MRLKISVTQKINLKELEKKLKPLVSSIEKQSLDPHYEMVSHNCTHFCTSCSHSGSQSTCSFVSVLYLCINVQQVSLSVPVSYSYVRVPYDCANGGQICLVDPGHYREVEDIIKETPSGQLEVLFSLF